MGDPIKPEYSLEISNAMSLLDPRQRKMIIRLDRQSERRRKALLLLRFILALLPIIWLIVALSGLKMAGHRACVAALIMTMALAIGYWKLSTLCTATAALEGALNALWPICLVIVAALFTYNLTLKTGAMELIKKCSPASPGTNGCWPRSSDGALGTSWRGWPGSARL